MIERSVSLINSVRPFIRNCYFFFAYITLTNYCAAIINLCSSDESLVYSVDMLRILTLPIDHWTFCPCPDCSVG